MNSLKIYTLPLLLASSLAWSQSVNIIRDSLTQKPIPYVNIWIENEMIGVTSNEKGEFYFTQDPIGKPVIFSSIGYQTKRIIFDNDIKTIKLKQAAIQLDEIVITTHKNSNRRKLGELNSGIRHFFACSGYPYIVGKFFPYTKEANTTEFIETIEVFTWSRIKQAKLNIRLYRPTKSGDDFELIYHENLIVPVKNDKIMTRVDVKNKQIVMPKEGLMVAAEFLIIDSNKYEYTYSMKGKKEKLKGTSYEPSIGTVPQESNENSWQYNNGKWKKVERMTYSGLPEYQNKFTEPAIKITLTD